MQDGVLWVCGISSVFSYFTLCNRVGDGKGEHEGLYGVCMCGQGMVHDVERERDFLSWLLIVTIP